MIYSIVSARGGSKNVPKKNVRLIGGYPLIAYAIAASKLVKKIDRTIVSTDSEEIADVAKRYGAEVPFLRPAEISRDNSTDLELIEHAIGWFSDNERAVPSLFVHLRPTTPLRVPSEITRAIEYILAYPASTALRSVHEIAEPPYKVFKLDKEGYLAGFFPDDPRPEYYNLPRQLFPKAYHPNGYVDIVKTDFVRKAHVLHGKKMLGFVTLLTAEVDRPEDLEYIQYQLERYGSPIYDYLTGNFPGER